MAWATGSEQLSAAIGLVVAVELLVAIEPAPAFEFGVAALPQPASRSPPRMHPIAAPLTSACMSTLLRRPASGGISCPSDAASGRRGAAIAEPVQPFVPSAP